jgi:hypothetical protein
VVTASEFSDVPLFRVDSPADPMTGLPTGGDLAEALTAAARQLHEPVTPHGTLRTAVRLAVRLMPGAEHAGVSVVERGSRNRSLAWTDELVRSAEAGQTAEGQASHLDDLWTTPVRRVEDSAADAAGRPLADLGLRSALSLRLRADRRRLTVLTAYARGPRVFDDAATRIGRLFTAHVSIALDAATVREQLTEAMRTRDLIGQATGILMERLGTDAATAFEDLVRASQRENVKLRDLARRVVDTA